MIFRPAIFLLFFLLIATPSVYAEQEPAPTTFESVADAIAVAQTSDFGQGGPAMEYLRTRVAEVQLDPAARNDLANALAVSLDDEASTYAYKVFACRQLYIIGGEDQIDELAPLLRDPKMANAARYALEVIPGATISDILWEAIATSDAPTSVGLVSSLAARGGASTVMRLGELLSAPHHEVVAAAVVGLGHIGGDASEKVLRDGLAGLPEDLHTVYYDALLACAEQYQAAGRIADTGRIYQELLQPALPRSVRLAALHGLVALQGENAAPLVVQALISGDAPWVTATMAYVRTLGGPKATLLFSQQLALLTPDVQSRLIEALADRGDATALPAVVAGLNSAAPEVQYAAIDALGMLGNETSVTLLLAGLISSNEETVQRCHQSLVRISDAGVNGALAEAYGRGEDDIRTAMAPILAERQAVEALPALYAVAANQSGDARRTAFNAIGAIARENDMDQVCTLYYEADEEEPRRLAAEALTGLCRRVAPSDARSMARATIYTLAPTSLTRAGALEIYRNLGDDVLLPLVISACGDSDSIVRDAAIAALSGWPKVTPIKEVYALAKDGDTEAHRALALDGYIRMLRLQSTESEAEKVSGFETAIALAANNPEVIRTVLAGLSELGSGEALNLVEGYLADPTLHPEAAVVAEKIRSKSYVATASLNSATAKNALDGSIESFWESGLPQAEGQWFEIDLSRPASIKGIVLDSSRTINAYPREYSVQVYAKGAEPGAAIVTGTGVEGVTEITFPAAVTGQVVRITQTGSDPEAHWVIHELRILPE